MKNIKYQEGLQFEEKYHKAILFKDSLEKKAIDAYMEAAKKGHALAQYRLAIYYSNDNLNDKEWNDNVKNNIALYWLKRAALSKYEKAIFEYADYCKEHNRSAEAIFYYEDLDLNKYPSLWTTLYELYKINHLWDKAYMLLEWQYEIHQGKYWPFEKEYLMLKEKYKNLICSYKDMSKDEISDMEEYHSILYAYHYNQEAFYVYDFEDLACINISNKANQYIYMSSRKYMREYYRKHVDEIKDYYEFLLAVIGGYSDIGFDEDLLDWADYLFVNEKNAWACGQLAELYLDGLGVDRNLEKAFELLMVAHENNAGDEATIRLADCYYFGYGVNEDMNKAYELYTSASICDENGWHTILDDESLKREVNIAWCAYLTGHYDVSYPLLKKLVEDEMNDHPSILYGYAYSNDYGFGCKVDDVLAAKLYEFNVKTNQHSSSMNNLGLLYLLGEGVETNFKKAFELFKQSNETYEDQYNCYNLGRCYYYGWGVEKDYNKAFSYFIKNKDTDSHWSKKFIGQCYRFGYGIEKDDALAFKYLFEANQHIQDNKTKYELARSYYDGIGTTKDRKKAFEYFSELVLDDYKSAYNYLGLCYLNGYGVEKDTTFAYKLFKQANEKKKTSATLYNLGLCYEKGYGVEVSFNIAFDYYQQSSELGGKKAIEKLEKLKK